MDISTFYSALSGGPKAASSATSKPEEAAAFSKYLASVEASNENSKDSVLAGVKPKSLPEEPKPRTGIRDFEFIKLKSKNISSTIDPDLALKYQKIIDQMMFKANQSSNQMSDAGRARVSGEFEELTGQLISQLEKSGMIDDSVMPFFADYIESWDISTKAGANAAFNDLYNFNNYIDQMDGTYEEPPEPGTDYDVSLDTLIQMANRSSGHMTEQQRADLNEKFDKHMDKFLEQLRDANVFDNDVVMNFVDQYLSGFDISNQADAQRAFNELYNMKNYIQTLV